MEIKKILTGRKVRTTVWRAYENGKVVKFRGLIVSSDDRDSLIKKLKTYNLWK